MMGILFSATSLKDESVVNRQIEYIGCIGILLMMVVSGCAMPSAPESRQEEILLTRLVDLQTRQEDKLSEVRQLAHTQQEQYGQLAETLEALLKATEEHKKNFREIRSAVAEVHKNQQPATRTDSERITAPATLPSKKVVGGVTHIHFVQPDVVLLARVDTGAETASLDARNIERFERDGEQWVRFDIPDPQHNRRVSTEQKLSRKVKILQAATESTDRRLVVELAVEIAGISQVAEFTLTDREHMSYPVLIGRNILKDVMVVDVALPVPKHP